MKQLNTLIVLLSLCVAGTAQPPSLWENPINGESPGQHNPYNMENVVADGIDVSGIGRGDGVSGNTANERYNTDSWATASSMVSDEYLYFRLDPLFQKRISYTDLELTFQRSSSGPSVYDLRSSVDEFKSSIATGNIPTSASEIIFSLAAADFQNTANSIEFRIYAWGATRGNGTFSVNYFKFSGTVTNALPITLSSIKAIKKNNQINIRWTTLAERNNDYFELQLSQNGVDFETIKTLKSKNGNSEMHQHYDVTIALNEAAALITFPALCVFLLCYRRRKLWLFTLTAIVSLICIASCTKSAADIKQIKNSPLFVRIKQVDKDGTQTYSKAVKVIHQ